MNKKIKKVLKSYILFKKGVIDLYFTPIVVYLVRPINPENGFLENKKKDRMGNITKL